MSEENRESSNAAAGQTEAEEALTTRILETESQPEREAESESRPDSWPEEPIPPVRAVPKAPRPVTQARVFLTSFGLGLLLFVLAVAVSLGILFAYNGGLWYTSPNLVVAVSRQVDALIARIDVRVPGLEGLRVCLDNLAGLSGRIEVVEATTDGLQAGVAELQTRLDALQDLDGRVDAVQEAADQLQTDAKRLLVEVQAAIDALLVAQASTDAFLESTGIVNTQIATGEEILVVRNCSLTEGAVRVRKTDLVEQEDTNRYESAFHPES